MEDTNKIKIDTLLALNSSIWANLGTNNNKDIKTKEAGKLLWKLILEQIKEIDPNQYNQLNLKS